MYEEAKNRMKELLTHRHDKQVKTLNLFDDIECLLQEIKTLESQVRENKKSEIKFRKYLIDCIEDLNNVSTTSELQNTISNGIINITGIILSKFNEDFSGRYEYENRNI